VFGRRRWLNDQSGAFLAAIRVTHGEVDGISSKWKRGTGRWVRDVLVWSKAPFMFRTQLIPIDSVSGERQAAEGELKRLGDRPAVVACVAGDSTIELAANAEHRALLGGPFAAPDVMPLDMG
jgi:hypothetical protein